MSRVYLCANPRMAILPALSLGFLLGVRHATDADHVAAIGTIMSDGRSARQAAMIGAAWGVGHSLSVLLVGGALVAFRLPMPARVAVGLEFLVALMLIGLGVRTFLTAPGTASSGTMRPLLVGVVHGMAGSAVLALLVLATTSTAAAAAAYLALFAVGTIAGMSAVTALMTVPARLRPGAAARYQRGVRLAAGAASVAIGVVMAFQLTVRDGLFAATVNWSP